MLVEIVSLRAGASMFIVITYNESAKKKLNRLSQSLNRVLDNSKASDASLECFPQSRHESEM